MNVTVEDRPELRVATVHHVGPYHRISEAFQRLGDIAGPAGLLQLPEAAMLAGYLSRRPGLGDVWSRLTGQWLPTSGHRVRAGSSYKIYRNNPTNTPPAQLRTDLYLPIA